MIVSGPARRPGDPSRVRLSCCRSDRRSAPVSRGHGRARAAARAAGAWLGARRRRRRARGERTLREVLAVVVGGPAARRGRPLSLGGVAVGRARVTAFLRAASAPTSSPPDAPRVETAVYPGAPLARGIECELVVAARRARRAARAGGVDVGDRPVGRRVRRSSRRAGKAEGREVVTLGSEHADAVRTAHWAPRSRRRVRRDRRAQPQCGRRCPTSRAVVVLDEGDEALEDERAPTWNARDVALERAARVGAAVRVLRPRRPSTRWSRSGSRSRSAGAVAGRAAEVVDQRDEEPGHGLLERRARRRAPPHRRPRRAGGVRAQPPRAGASARVPDVRELARCEVCGATVEQRDDGPRVRAVRDRAPVGVPALPRQRRSAPCAPGHHARARRPRRAAAARGGGVGRRRDRRGRPTCPCSSAPRRCCTGSRRARRRPGGWSPTSSSTRSCSRRGPGPPSRRCGSWCGAPGSLDDAPGRLLLQTRLPDHEVVRGGAPRAIRCSSRRPRHPPRRRSASHRSVGWPRCAARPRRSAAACAAVRRGGGDRPRSRWPTAARGARARAERRRALRRARRVRRRGRPDQGTAADRRRSAPGLTARRRAGQQVTWSMYPLRLFGDPVLKQRAREVDEIDGDLVTLVHGDVRHHGPRGRHRARRPAGRGAQAPVHLRPARGRRPGS